MRTEIRELITAIKIMNKYKDMAVGIQDMNYIHLYHTEGYTQLVDVNSNIIGLRFQDLHKDEHYQYALSLLRVTSEYVNQTGIKTRTLFTYTIPDTKKKIF